MHSLPAPFDAMEPQDGFRVVVVDMSPAYVEMALTLTRGGVRIPHGGRDRYALRRIENPTLADISEIYRARDLFASIFRYLTVGGTSLVAILSQASDAMRAFGVSLPLVDFHPWLYHQSVVGNTGYVGHLFVREGGEDAGVVWWEDLSVDEVRPSNFLAEDAAFATED